MKQFTKSDLKDYMKVVTRNGMVYIKEGMRFERAKGYNPVQCYEEDLTMLEDSDFDIMEVYEPTLDGWNLLWKREEPKYMLLFPAGMFGTNSKLIKFPTYYDWVDISYEDSEKFKAEFTQEEIDAIPFNTDIFTKVEIER